MEKTTSSLGESKGKVFIAKRIPTLDILKRIIETLEVDEYFTSTDVSERIGVSRPTVKKYLDALVDLGETMRKKGVPVRLVIGGTDVYIKEPITLRRRRGR